ncbi:MAG: hypothetical protein MI784_05620 [Cytophagales bacterium]|nr:hypothetical protein [Cytophagales bacterium]
MRAKKFLINSFGISIGVVVLFAAVNYRLDYYGLFGFNKEVKIYTSERLCKYLIAQNYLKDYDGIIAGPSLSANLNPALLSNGKYYNLSVMGATASEMATLSEHTLGNGKLRTVLFCIDPYIFRFNWEDEVYSSKQYYGAYGSTSLLRNYFVQFLTESQLFPKLFPKGLYGPNGRKDYNKRLNRNDPESYIRKELKRPLAPLVVNDDALQRLKDLFVLLRKKKVQVIAYYHPFPAPIQERRKEQYREFLELTRSLFTEKDLVLDFNTPEYSFFREDLDNYIDHGHLSELGQKKLLRMIDSLTVSQAPIPLAGR